MCKKAHVEIPEPRHPRVTPPPTEPDALVDLRQVITGQRGNEALTKNDRIARWINFNVPPPNYGGQSPRSVHERLGQRPVQVQQQSGTKPTTPVIMYAEGNKSSKRTRWSPAPSSSHNSSVRHGATNQQQQPSGWQPVISTIGVTASADSASSSRRPRKTRWDEPPKGCTDPTPPPMPPPQTAIIPSLGPGLPASAPATHAEIQDAINDLSRRNAYLDDILLSSDNEDMHAIQRRLRQDRLQALIRKLIREDK